MYSPKPLEKKITLPYLNSLKAQGEKFVCLTAYDYSFARLLENSGVEVILVGDSLGMVIQGHDTTLPVTVQDIEYHARAVSRGLEKAMLMVDMPFGSLNSQQQALDNASLLMKSSGAQVVKLEGGITQIKTVVVRRGRFRPHFDPTGPDEERLLGAFVRVAHARTLGRRLRAALEIVKLSTRALRGRS